MCAERSASQTIVVIWPAMKTDPRVAAYIAKAPPFARDVLNEARSRVQKALPEVEETIKWNVPFFLLSGKIVASMAAFKKHVKVGVWVGMAPTFQDVASVAELVPAKDFATRLKAAAKQSGAAMNSHPAKKAPAKKVPAKKAPAKKAPAKKAPAKKACLLYTSDAADE